MLQGFRPFTQAGVIVNSDQTARADARLEIGTMEEGIVVSGESPLLDTSSALKQTVLTQEVLESLPNRMDVWSITRVIPSIVVSKVDVGGSESFLQSGVTVRGTDNEGGYYIDGMDVSSLDGEGDGATMYLDPYAFAESNFLAGNNPAESPRGGLVFNMVTKTGTNQLHGGAMFSGANRGMGFDNFSDQLRSRSCWPPLSPAVLAASPEIKPGADINYIWDTGFWLAGPIVQDKLWFSTTYHYQKLLQFFLGSYNPDGTQTPDDHYLYTTNNKVAWQMSRTSQFSYYFTLQRKVNGHRLGGSFADSRASNNNNKYPTVHQVKWTRSQSSRLLFDAATSHFLVDDRFSRQPDVQDGDIARFDSVTNYGDDCARHLQQQPDVPRRAHRQRQLFHDDARHQGRLLDELREADGQRVFDLRDAGGVSQRHSRPRQHLEHAGQLGDAGSRTGTVHSGQVASDAQADVESRPAVRDQLRLDAGDLPAADAIHRRAVFRGHRRRARLESGESAVLGRVRSARRRLDRAEVCGQPIRRSCGRAGCGPHQPGPRHQRQPSMVASEPLRRSRDARLRSQRRPDSTIE